MLKYDRANKQSPACCGTVAVFSQSLRNVSANRGNSLFCRTVNVVPSRLDLNGSGTLLLWLIFWIHLNVFVQNTSFGLKCQWCTLCSPETLTPHFWPLQHSSTAHSKHKLANNFGIAVEITEFWVLTTETRELALSVCPVEKPVHWKGKDTGRGRGMCFSLSWRTLTFEFMNLAVMSH